MSLLCKNCGKFVSSFFLFVMIIIGLISLFYGLIKGGDASSGILLGPLAIGSGFILTYCFNNSDYCGNCTPGLNKQLIMDINDRDPLLSKAISLTYEPSFLETVTKEWLDKNIGLIETDINKSRYYEASGNFEEAARICEKRGLVEEARQLREKKIITVKEVKVDLNQLVDQLNQRGITININCKNCGGPINVNSMKLEGLRVCNYCGSALDVVSIQEIITKTLS